jgi:hypothetical protein
MTNPCATCQICGIADGAEIVHDGQVVDRAIVFPCPDCKGVYCSNCSAQGFVCPGCTGGQFVCRPTSDGPVCGIDKRENPRG